MQVPSCVGLICVLLVAYVCPNLGSRIVDCFHDVVAWLGDNMFVWPVMACYENCFVGISYTIIGLDNRVVFAHV